LASYSVVRFIPDLERREPVNVGVLLVNADDVAIKFVDRPELGDGQEAVARYEGLLRHLLEEKRSEDVDSFDAFIFVSDLASRRFSHFEITEPREVAPVGEPQSLIEELAERIVQPAATQSFVP